MAELLEQQEKLRRAVDECRLRSHALLFRLHGDSAAVPPPSSTSTAASASDPIHVHVEPIEHAALSALLQSDDVSVSKFVTVLAYDCMEVSRLRRFASRNLYRQLVLFGHSASPQEVLLEGEPQKLFGKSMSLFIELYETTSRMMDVLGNILQQLNSIYSLHDKNVRPLSSFKDFTMTTAFESLGDGLAMFIVLDDIIKQNEYIKGYLSLFSRMLHKAKMEVDSFYLTTDDIDLLGQVISHLEKNLEVCFFKRFLQGESPWQAILEKIRCNKKLISGCTSFINEHLSKILLKLDTWKEFPHDRQKLLRFLGLFLFTTHVSAEAPQKKMEKLFFDMIQLIPHIYVEGGKRIVLMDLLKSQCPESLLSWPLLRETSSECNIIKNNFLKRLNKIQARDWQTIKDAISCWLGSFQTIYPSMEMMTEDWIRLHFAQIMQGLLLANRLHILILSILDMHALLEVPIKREKLKTLCHMIVSLKVLGNTFHSRGSEMILSLPHIINVIEADMEKLILPSKARLQVEVLQKSQMNKYSIFSSLLHVDHFMLGGKEMETSLKASLSLVSLLLQLLQGGGSNERRLIFLVALDVLQSIGHADTNFSRIRKLAMKLETLANFKSVVEDFTDCSFLYWRKEMIRNLFCLIYTDVSRLSWLQYALDAFSDGLYLLKLGHVGNHTRESYEKEIERSLKDDIINPLCKDIETDLRLHVHSTYIKGSVTVNPTKTGVRNLSWYLQIKPLHLPFKLVDIKLLVENYLNSAFYNHLTVSSYEWKIYSEMQQLAELKNGLNLDGIHIYLSSIIHNFESDNIVRNLDIFTENYSYNIIRQIFTEKVSQSQNKKNLQVIGLENFTTSFAIRGAKSACKVSDCVMKFVKKMLMQLSQLVQEEYMKPESSKGSISWKSEKETNMQSFSQQSEEQFSLRKLSLGKSQTVSFIEKFQSISCKIGNALGLMRILLASRSHYSYNISCFISTPHNDASLTESCLPRGLIDETTTAVLDNVMENCSQMYDSAKSFLCFIDTLIEELHSMKDDYPKDFFLLIPHLLQNLVDSTLQQKAKFFVKDDDPGTNLNMYDGCAMGITLLLKILGQENLFDELQWFASVSGKLGVAVALVERNNKVTDKRKEPSLSGWKFWSNSPSVPAEVQKDLDKHKRYREELELVEYALTIARTVMS